MKGEYFKMYYEDWDEGIECFGGGMAALALNGAYIAAVNQMFRRGGFLLDDLRVLARLWDVRISDARKLRASLVETHRKLESKCGQLVCKRVTEELEVRRNLSAARSNSSKLRTSLNPILPDKPLKTHDTTLPFAEQEVSNCSANAKQDSTYKSRVEKSIEEEKRGDKQVATAVAAAVGADWDFDLFWGRYPHKIGKEGKYGARNAFAKAAKTSKISFDDLLSGLQRYIDSKPPEREWCNPATWLNQGRWGDAPAAPVVAARKDRFDVNGPHNLVTSADRVAAKFDAVFQSHQDRSRPLAICDGTNEIVLPLLPECAGERRRDLRDGGEHVAE